MINGINHITFAVSDLARSIEFYHSLLGLKLVAKWDQGAYLLAGDVWIALNVDLAVCDEPKEDYTHIAFNVPSRDFASFRRRLLRAGVEIFQENRSEGDSLYFLDPDGHKLEIHYRSLKHRLASMRGNKAFQILKPE